MIQSGIGRHQKESRALKKLKEETLWQEMTGDLPYIDPNKT
jgi:hypothetical protein